MNRSTIRDHSLAWFAFALTLELMRHESDGGELVSPKDSGQNNDAGDLVHLHSTGRTSRTVRMKLGGRRILWRSRS